MLTAMSISCIFSERITASDTSQKEVEELQKEVEELKKTIEQLTEENTGLKEQVEKLQSETMGETEAPAPELPENVADADTKTEYSDKSTVLLVQQTLNKLGYNCGSADGVAGAKTRDQITAYETDNGLTVNGVITDQLLESMGIADKVAAEAKKEAEKASYSSDYSYEQLARNPDNYIGEKMKFTGKVLQAQTGDTCYLRLAINSDYDKVIFVTYDKNLIDYRILEDDKVTIYGNSMGDYSYEAVSGATITIPWLWASIIELK